MEKKRIFALLLAVCMLLGMLAGCGSSSDDTSEAEETEEAEEETEEAEEAEEEAEEAEEEAEEAEETEEAAEEETAEEEEAEEAAEETAEEAEEEAVTISWPLVEETETLSIWCTEVNFMGAMADIEMEWGDYDVFKQLEEETNVHIEFETVSFEYYSNYFNIYIAAGDYADMIINMASAYTGGLTSAYDQGVIVDITPYLEEHAPDYYAFINSDDTLHDYAYGTLDEVLTFICAYDTAGVKNGNLVRGDWMEAFGMDTLETTDDLHDYLLAAKTEYDVESPIFMSDTCSEFMSAWDMLPYSVGGGDLSFYVVDGEVRTAINQDSFKDYLTTMNEWYEEGLLYQDFATYTYDPHDNSMTQMIYNGQIATWATQLEGIDDYEQSSPDENFVSQPIPNVTVSGDVNHCVEVEYVITSSDISITTSCDNVELAVEWMNYWYTEEGIHAYNYGIEGETWHYDDDGVVVLEDFVVNNEYDTDVSSFLRIYCPYGSFTGVYLRSRLQDYQSELATNCETIWSESTDGAYIIPTGVSLTSEQTEELSATAADVMTYADSCIPRFIMGDMDIETEWDTYIESLYSMGLERCIEIEQEAYDSYVG